MAPDSQPTRAFTAHPAGPCSEWLCSELEALAHRWEAVRSDDPSTRARFDLLSEVSRRSLVLGRLFEGHVDGVTIARDAGVTPPSACAAVWASEHVLPPVTLARSGADGWVLDGVKPFCSGASLVSWALVTARHEGTVSLALVDLSAAGITVQEPEWVGAGMRAADTRSVRFDRTPVNAVVGDPGWYLARPGFWHGAVSVAASWFGGAQALLDAITVGVGDDPHALAHLGQAAAEVTAMASTLTVAAAEIDRTPNDARTAHHRALLVRAVVERGCRAVLEHTVLALGPAALALDPVVSQQVADLQVYIRQHHGGRDLEELGRSHLERAGATPC